MADEEAVLKKKLEDTTDFEERRAIRQQLRELRKKKLDALESSPSMNERPRRRERIRKEEKTTVITETNTTDNSSLPTTRAKMEVNYSCTVTTNGPAENGHVENGIQDGENVFAEADTCVKEQPVKHENETEVDVNIKRDTNPQENEAEQLVVSVPQEQPSESEAVDKSSEMVNSEEKDPAKDQTDEVDLTPEVVEKIEDIDMLEKLLKEVPLNEYALRKAIRLQIRQLRVKKETSTENENLLVLEKGTKAKDDIDLPGNDFSEYSTQSRNHLNDNAEVDLDLLESTNVNSETTVSGSEELEAVGEIKTEDMQWGSEKSESDCDVDNALSVGSRSVLSEDTSENDKPKKPPQVPPRPSKTSSTSSEAELTGDFKSRILGNPAGPPLRDLSRKVKSQPEQVDFRGQLKRTGLRADKDLTAQGKKRQQVQEGDFRGQLKATGVDTSKNPSGFRFAGSKNGSPAQVDFRGQLKRTPDECQTSKVTPPRPPPTYLKKKSESDASVLSSMAKSETAKPPSKRDVKTSESSAKEVRKISSADLFNMLHKPAENSKEDYLVQRGLKTAEASKSTQKFNSVSLDTSVEDEKFKARMAWRKQRSDKQFLPGKGSKDDRKMSAGVETKDFQAILKKAGVQQSRMGEKITGEDTKGQMSTDAGKWSEKGPVDIVNKDELQKLRADLLHEKEQKTKGGDTTSTPETHTSDVVQVDGAQVSTQNVKTTEVHKTTGGATMTVTKTTSKREVRKTAPGKGTSIEAMLAQKRREKMMAKKEQQTDTRTKRMAFKEKLEAQSPKVEGGGRNFQSGNAAINSLQEWCRRRTVYHEGVDIQNFTTSWANGLAMCALLNYYLPEKIPFETLDPNDKKGNWSLAFKVANEEGIEPLLELEDVMAVDVPEPKSLITYVHFIYQHFSQK